MLRDLYPKSKMIVILRDLRAIFGSIEKQHRVAPILDATDDSMRTIDGRANAHFSANGMIGCCLRGIQDLLNRKIPNVYYLRFEDLVINPRETLKGVYNFIELEPLHHDLDDIKNYAQDPDNMLLFKFPHKGCGKLEKPDFFEFRKYYNSSIEDEIMSRNDWYYKTFYSDGVLDG